MRQLALFPRTAEIRAGEGGEQLLIAGHDLAALAAQYGTPLYLYDQATLEMAVTEYRQALATHYPGESGLTYAGKAFLCLAMAQWVGRQGLLLDCSGLGELAVAQAAALPPEQTLVHGVNKSPEDLGLAWAQAGIVVVDNRLELDRLARLAAKNRGRMPALWLRYRPGQPVLTHAYIQTGHADSKFGMNGAEIREAARFCRDQGLLLTGLHFHLGSQFRDPAALAGALEKALDLMAAAELGPGSTLCPGGGLGVAYHEDDLPQPSIRDYVAFIAETIVAGCQRQSLPLPRLQLEPGRSLVARAGVALYRVGAVKQAAGRRWLLLDGGLADNPRPALYGARYSALPVLNPDRHPIGPASLGGPYCESGDILIAGLPFADVETGELIAIPVSGAYQLSMASNYNGARRPAVLWLTRDWVQLIRARETTADLLRYDRSLTN